MHCDNCGTEGKTWAYCEACLGATRQKAAEVKAHELRQEITALKRRLAQLEEREDKFDERIEAQIEECSRMEAIMRDQEDDRVTLREQVSDLEQRLAETEAALGEAVEKMEELKEVADLRGDNDLPHPSDDPKTWTARMQDAWDELAEFLDSSPAHRGRALLERLKKLEDEVKAAQSWSNAAEEGLTKALDESKETEAKLKLKDAVVVAANREHSASCRRKIVECPVCIALRDAGVKEWDGNDAAHDKGDDGGKGE